MKTHSRTGEVRAAKIEGIGNPCAYGGVMLTLEGGEPFHATDAMIAHHIPKIGDYVVETSQGKISLMGAAEFEEVHMACMACDDPEVAE